MIRTGLLRGIRELSFEAGPDHTGDPAIIFMVEFAASEPAPVLDRINAISSSGNAGLMRRQPRCCVLSATVGRTAARRRRPRHPADAGVIPSMPLSHEFLDLAAPSSRSTPPAAGIHLRRGLGRLLCVFHRLISDHDLDARPSTALDEQPANPQTLRIDHQAWRAGSPTPG
ncbi:MAG: hypothetical protein H6705_12325 [Myxococcales bacterium]|nr:hypothetical protein [Myxococcales bacterium]